MLAEKIVTPPFPDLVTSAGYTIGVRPIKQCIRQMLPMTYAHWDEQGEENQRAGTFTAKEAIASILTGEEMGALKYIAVLKGDRLVGHFGLKLWVDYNINLLVAGDAFIYISPEHRKGLLGVQLIRYARDLAKSLGAREFSVSYRTFGSVDLDVALRRVGMKHTANVYSIILEG